MGPRLVWLVTLPLALAGCELGHAAVNALIGSPAGPGGELFEGAGPGSELVPWLAAAAIAIVLLALASRAAGAWASSWRSVPALPFALLSPTVFVLQEHLEQLLHSGAVPLGTVLEPTFLPGLALQLPFAVAAYLIARALLRVADVARRLITRRSEALLFGESDGAPHRPSEDQPYRPLRASVRSGRGPPVGLIASH